MGERVPRAAIRKFQERVAGKRGARARAHRAGLLQRALSPSSPVAREGSCLKGCVASEFHI